MSNTAAEKNLIFNVKRGFTQEDAIVVESSTRAIGLYSTFPTSTVTIGGSLTIGGDLTVTGNTTTVNTEVLTIEDKNIELATGSTSDTTADGGGITLKGTTDHTLTWTQASTAWNSSEHINLASGKEFKINGITVLSGTSLGSGITAIPGVTSFGTQNVINIGPGLPPVTRMRLLDTTISTVSNNYDITLDPDGTGNIVLNSSARIRLLADPVDQQDAATKEYVDNIVETRPILLSLDLSDGQTNVYIINNILNVMAPPGADYRDGLYAKILCSVLSNSTTLLDINPLVAAGTSTATFVTPGPGTAPAVTNISVAPATVAAAPLSVIRFIKTFRIEVGVWTHQSDSSTF
jgi:hypothetical protein